MPWNDVQTASDNITHTEWNSMVSAIRYEPTHFTIYKIDSTYYCKDGLSGDVVSSSTHADVPIQWAANHITSGGKIWIRGEGEFTMHDTVSIVSSDITIEGSGMALTTLKLANNVNVNMFEWLPGSVAYNLRMINIFLHGNDANNSSGTGLYTNANARDGQLFRMESSYFANDGLNLGNGWGWFITNSIMEYNNEWGLRIRSGTEAHVIGCKIIDNEGAICNSSARSVFIGNHLGDSQVTSVWDYGPYAGANITYNRYIGNFFHDSSQGAGDHADLMLHKSNRTIVNGNVFFGNSSSVYNIELKTAYSDTITNNYFIGSTTTAIYFPPNLVHNAIIQNNHNYHRVQTGTISASNGDTIAHGLASTPSVVFLHTSNATHISSCSIKDATNLTVHLCDSTGVTVGVNELIYWRAEVL